MFNRVCPSFIESYIENSYLPNLSISMIYRNVLGGIFKTTQNYELWIHEEDMDTIKEWLKMIKNAKINYTEEIREIERNKEKSIKMQMFRNISDNFSSKINQKEVDLFLEPIPGTYNIEPLSKKEYIIISQKIGYSKRIGAPRKEVEEIT